ncbi:YIP1 family protein [Dyella flagellata]|uniref:Yip1 domain-containing protein n=1 Tax=Dyella flagellata TaxID=1867833 RepID=A0ABQ5X8E7_9GAMM|nr:YIP1 family protein [Dyella flagellata]GLQ87926.1 hypothetical protein GCM10007898_14940 [Dyella flagellata]
MNAFEDSSANQAQTAETKPLSQAERVINVFVAPSRTFVDILRSHSWWLPFLIMVVIGYAYLFIVQGEVGWDTIATNITRHLALPMDDPARAPRILEITIAIVKARMYAYPLIILVASAIAALLLSGTVNFLLGGKASFERVFAIWMYAMLPRTLSAIIPAAGLLLGMHRDSFYLSNPIGTNVGYYLSPSAPEWLMSVGTALDVLHIWSLILVSIGLSVVANISRASGFIAVFGWAVLIVLGKLAYAALSANMG